MTDFDICRKIAQYLEPHNPAILNEEEVLGVAPPPPCWTLNQLDDYSWQWEPRNFFTDPAARDLLVRKMLEEGKTILVTPVYDERSGKPTGEHSLQIENTFPVNEVVCIIFDTYDRIWPLAYLKTIPAGKEEA